jgi:Protein of unknown function (DUF3987)/Primase C terminal 2 (PriCT-2)
MKAPLDKPKTFCADIAKLPAALKPLTKQKRWVVWRWTWSGAKWDKPPYRSNNPQKKAATNNPKTWSSYAEAVKAVKYGKADGIGYVLTDSKIAAADLDDCRDPVSQKLTPWAAQMVAEAQAAGIYVETTVSGTGLRTVGTTTNSEKLDTKLRLEGIGALELYRGAVRYITISGLQIGKSRKLPNIDALLDRAYARYKPAHKSKSSDDKFSSNYPPATREEIQAALDATPSDGYKIWYENGCALYKEFGEDGFALFEPWSKKSEKYNERQCLKQWKACKKRIDAGGDYGAGTIKHYANEADPDWRARYEEEKAQHAAQPQENVEPVDLWGQFEPPALPRQLLPKVIEDYAFTTGETMGADPAGLAMAALTVCGAAITDDIKLQMKKHSEDWNESARFWTALVGLPSFKKTPAMMAAAKALRKRDHELLRQYQSELKRYQEMETTERKDCEPPLQKRLCLEDTTIEAAQEVLVGSPNGVLLYQDELSGFFGSMDKYASGRGGAAKDRAFWLQSWSGGPYGLNRIGRGVSMIPNLSISLLGGIQPDVIRKISAESHDDGFLARMLIIMARAAVMGTDVKMLPVATTYAQLVERLTELIPPAPFGNIPVSLGFDAGAQKLRAELERKHLELAQQFEMINKKLAAAIGKYDGYFGRLCLLWHCIEHAREKTLPQLVTENTARRVAKFMDCFLRPHAVAFYCGVLGLADEHDRLASVAGYILAHRLEKVTNRDIQRGDRTMRGLTRRETDNVCEQLEALGWVTRTPGPRQGLHWIVNPAVHVRFAERAAKEAARRAATRELILNQVRGGAHGS